MAMSGEGLPVDVGAVSSSRRQVRASPKQVPGKLKQGRATGEDGLNPRERQFIGQMCLNGFRATDACRSLAFGGKRPEVEASRLMGRPAIKAEIEKRQKALESKVEITIDRIAAEYAKLAFAAFDGPLTASNKVTALDALGKWRGMFKPDQAVVIPVTFQFLNGPSPDAGTVVDAAPQPQPTPDAGTLPVPELGRPERG